MSRISKSNKITRIHQLCSLEANYKSQGDVQNCGVQTPQPEFLGWKDTHDTQSGCATVTYLLTY